MSRITRFVILDIFKNKMVIAYTILLAVLVWSAFALEDSSEKGVLTVLNIILLTVPLVAIIFSTIYIYNSGEFIGLLLSQPVQRKKIWWSIFSGLAMSLSASFFIAAGTAVIVYAPVRVAATMVVTGILVTIVFVALACLAAVLTRDKAKGIGLAIMIWLFFALIFDGILLFLVFQFGDYQIEKPMIALTCLSPISLARILMLLQLDVSAMLGYTGAVFKQFFGTIAGFIAALCILALWAFIPFWISLKRFVNRDL